MCEEAKSNILATKRSLLKNYQIFYQAIDIIGLDDLCYLHNETCLKSAQIVFQQKIEEPRLLNYIF